MMNPLASVTSLPVSCRAIAASLALAAACLLGGPAGCMKARLGGSMEPDKVIDELREDNLALQRQVQDLQKQIDLRLAQIDTLNQQVSQNGDGSQAGVDVPRAVKLVVGRYSGILDTDGDDQPDVVRLYLTPRDQRGRFLPVAGQATVQVVAIPAQGEPVQVARREYDAASLDGAYRTGMTGTHYTLEVPLPQPLPEPLTKLPTLTVQVSITDAATGATLTHQQALPLR